MELGLKGEPEVTLGLAPRVHVHTGSRLSKWLVKGARQEQDHAVPRVFLPLTEGPPMTVPLLESQPQRSTFPLSNKRANVPLTSFLTPPC